MHKSVSRPILAAAALVTATVAVTGGAGATAPGTPGRIAIERESVAGDHTQTDIFTIARNGSDPVQLTATPARNEFGPAWSPDGTRIVFWRTRAPFGPGSLWVMNADGGGLIRLTNGVDARDPAWNPAMTRIAYTGPGRHGDTDIWSLRVADPSDRRRETAGRSLDFEPDWAPRGGSRIAFTRADPGGDGDPGDIAVLDRQAAGATKVTRGPLYDHQVSWSPGGGRLVFERDDIQSSRIFRVGASGRNLRRLTGGSFFDVGPVYSPNGRLVAFGSDRAGLLGDIWVMRSSDGSDRRLLADLGASEGFPSWQQAP